MSFGDCDYWKYRTQEAEDLADRCDQQVGRLRDRLTDTEGELAEQQAEIARLKREVAAVKVSLQERDQELEETKEKLDEAMADLAAARERQP